MTETIDVMEKFSGTPTLTSDKVIEIKKMLNSALEYYKRSGFIYCDGYANAVEDVLDVIYEQPEIVKKTHRLRSAVLVTGVVIGTFWYIGYKEQKKNGTEG